MIPALATLLVCQLLGEALVRTLAVPVPGPVVGMAGLLLALVLRPAWLAALKPTTATLLQHLSLLFVPAGVGVSCTCSAWGRKRWPSAWRWC